MSSKELRELEKIIGSLQKAVNRDNLPNNAQTEYGTASAYDGRILSTESKADAVRAPAMAYGVDQTIIYDEFEPPNTPPPIPPDNTDISPTIMFELAPPPPAPITKQKSLSALDQVAAGNITVTKQREQPIIIHKKPKFPQQNTQTTQIDRLKQVGPPRDVVLPPGNKSDSHVNTIEALPDEVDYGEDNEQEKFEEQKRRKDLSRMSQMIQFDKATVEDFKDLDNLLDDLDKIFVKSPPRQQNIRPPVPDIPEKYKPGILQPAVKPVPYFRPQMESLSGLTEVAQNLEAAVSSIDEMRRGDVQEERASKESSKISSSNLQAEKEDKIKSAMIRINEANVKKITTRIYIEHAKNFKTIVLTSLMSAEYVVKDLKRRYVLEDSSKWTLFELINDIGIERPLRDFEIVTDVIKTWDVETVNALLIKRYKYRESLTVEGAKESYPRMCGWLFQEIKKGKWQKKFFELKANGLYYTKDKKGANDNLLCSLSKYDVYTLMKAKSKAPTKFCFALKSSEPAKMFEDRSDYVYFLCVDDVDKMKDWVLSVRNAKSQLILDEHPEYMENMPLRAMLPKGNPLQLQKTQTLPHSKSMDDIAGSKATSKAKISTNVTSDLRETAWKDGQSRLIRKIEEQQGKQREDTKEIVNKTQFGYQGKPLVPLTAKEIQNVPGVAAQRYALPKPPGKDESSQEKLNIRMCMTCGCTDFARNPFRESSCANCFHVHEEKRK